MVALANTHSDHPVAGSNTVFSKISGSAAMYRIFDHGHQCNGYMNLRLPNVLSRFATCTYMTRTLRTYSLNSTLLQLCIHPSQVSPGPRGLTTVVHVLRFNDKDGLVESLPLRQAAYQKGHDRSSLAPLPGLRARQHAPGPGF